LDKTDKTLKENMETTKQEEPKALELIETMQFMDGPNKLEIRFSKRHNRMFRIQIFLNDEIEIRPVTYTGTSTGHSYWNLLKKSLKK
jgi:O-acetylhomoserine/O-acetylserine sulfhydrylase-like pyridoxal-dependent enzyme